MSFYQVLQQATAPAREHLFNAPIIEACRKGEISRDIYLRFLAEAYYHVRHTVPLWMATGGKLGQVLVKREDEVVTVPGEMPEWKTAEQD